MKNGQEVLFNGTPSGGSFVSNAVFLEYMGKLCGQEIVRIRKSDGDWLVKRSEVKTESEIAEQWRAEIIKASPSKFKKDLAAKLNITPNILNKRLSFCAIDFSALKEKQLEL